MTRTFHRRKHAPAASTGGGGFSGGVGGTGGSGGFGRGDGDDEEKPQPPKRVLWQGWADRVAADPQFTYKVLIEQVRGGAVLCPGWLPVHGAVRLRPCPLPLTFPAVRLGPEHALSSSAPPLSSRSRTRAEQIIGVGAAVAGDMASRPNWGLNELDFVFATLVVGSIVNFALMYLLAPTVAGAAGGGGLIGKIFSDQILVAIGAPGTSACMGFAFIFLFFYWWRWGVGGGEGRERREEGEGPWAAGQHRTRRAGVALAGNECMTVGTVSDRVRRRRAVH